MIVLAGILLLILVLLLIPVGAFVRYDDGALLVQAVIGPLRLTLWPQKPKDPDKLAKRGSKKKNEPPPPAGRTEEKKKLSWSQLRPLVDAARKMLGTLPKKLMVRELTVVVTAGGTDAAKAAIHYGRAWALIGVIMPVLENTFRIGKRHVEAKLDYGEERIRAFLQMDIRMRVITGLWLGLQLGVDIIKYVLENKKKAVQANESSSL